MTASNPSLDAPLADVVGADLHVPLVDGTSVRYANLDWAASAPALTAVQDAVCAALPWYSSVHRGAGFPSRVTSEALAAARGAVAAFVGARDDDEVVLTRNATDALNLLAFALPAGTQVVTFASEHHANLLPWLRRDAVVLPVPASPADAIRDVEAALAGLPGDGRDALVAVTGASNVTGEIWPIAELAGIARRAGARIAVDAAQLAPHRAIDLAATGIDFVAFSGHKLAAPFGAGAFVGRRDWLDRAQPYLDGGGAVDAVSLDRTTWKSGHDRHEAGTPNVVGAIALGVACNTLASIGFATIHAHEQALCTRLDEGLASVPGIEQYTMWEDADRIGVAVFNLADWDPALLAAVLSAEHGIGVRSGAFCAHPLVHRLVGGRPGGGRSGAVRASVGIGSRSEDVDRLVDALRTVARTGARVDYGRCNGRYEPADDPRRLPQLLGLAGVGA